MKLFYIIPLAITLALPVHGQQWHLRRLGSADYSYGWIVSDDYYDPSDNAPKSACIEVKNGNARNDQKLILGDCSGVRKKKQGWRLTGGLFHSQLNDDMCWQAGRDGPALDGEYIRLFECDESNDLQKFVHINGGGIRPETDQTLCAVWRGVNADIGRDPIILRDCDEVEKRNDWSGDF